VRGGWQRQEEGRQSVGTEALRAPGLGAAYGGETWRKGTQTSDDKSDDHSFTGSYQSHRIHSSYCSWPSQCQGWDTFSPVLPVRKE
jgi:hypothetical protein